ncbi:MAG: hypothetical protein LBS69_07425 [Prevotellaceae bacterium]|jgi:hypothetical protein|nr:hypothetical protein [Prevotellaceae bacterium]
MVLVEPVSYNKWLTNSFTPIFMALNDIDIGLEIRTYLQQQGIKVKWLAEQIGCDNSSLGKMLNKKHIYPELLLKISITLKTNFFRQYNQLFKKSTPESDNQ